MVPCKKEKNWRRCEGVDEGEPLVPCSPMGACSSVDEHQPLSRPRRLFGTEESGRRMSDGELIQRWPDEAPSNMTIHGGWRGEPKPSLLRSSRIKRRWSGRRDDRKEADRRAMQGCGFGKKDRKRRLLDSVFERVNPSPVIKSFLAAGIWAGLALGWLFSPILLLSLPISLRYVSIDWLLLTNNFQVPISSSFHFPFRVENPLLHNGAFFQGGKRGLFFSYSNHSSLRTDESCG